jgi:gamma-D-glutamyl-L-lysine dipeptidyl-peptidase
MDHMICVVPAAPVRKKASHKVEMSNQLLFGEVMRVIDAKKNWLRIQSVHDNYEGWIRNNLVSMIDPAPSNSFVAGELINTIRFGEQKMLIPFGSSLPGFENGMGSIAGRQYHFDGYAINRTISTADGKTIQQLTSSWLNAPYLWGGRTVLGVDCSGFAQVIFKMIGIDLLRDAKQQISQGLKVKKLESAQCGDLAFFHKKKKIVHVGILLSHTEIIHASGKVRIDKIDSKGVIHTGSGKRTHDLAGIRRYW